MATYFRASKDGSSKLTLSRDRGERLPSRPKLPPRIHLSRTKGIVDPVEPERSTDRSEKQVNWGEASEIVQTDGTAASKPHTARKFLLGKNNNSSMISRKNLLTAAGSRKNLLSTSSTSFVIAGLTLFKLPCSHTLSHPYGFGAQMPKKNV